MTTYLRQKLTGALYSMLWKSAHDFFYSFMYMISIILKSDCQSVTLLALMSSDADAEFTDVSILGFVFAMDIAFVKNLTKTVHN